MELGQQGDWEAVSRYDSHIPTQRLKTCIQNRQIYILRDTQGQIWGVLRYSLFWQTVPFVDLLYLDEKYRGRGLGSGMMAAWEAEMRRMGYRFVMLSTQADETAWRFYEKIGYRKIGAFNPPEQAAEEMLYAKNLGQED